MNLVQKLIIASLTFLLFTGSASAQEYEFNVREDSCNSGEEPLLSLYDKEGGNIGEPGYFKWQVCGSGVEEVNIREECGDETNSILSMYQRNDSHASIYESYRLNVCATFSASINNSCRSEDRIVSMVKEDNSHVGAPGELSNQLCAAEKGVESVTLEMSLSNTGDVYADGEVINEGTYTKAELDYPYIVTDEPAGIVNYGDLESISYSTKNSKSIFRMTQTDGAFILPNTQESYLDIDDEEDAITNRNFLQELEASFYYAQPELPTVRVILDSNTTLDGFDQELTNIVELRSRYSVDNKTETVINLEPR